jgi:hypothetical protein
VAKVTRAAMIRLATATASFAIVENAHAGIKETANAGLVAVIRSGISNFHYRTFLDLIRPENPELDTDHWLDIRIWTMYSRWHLSSVLFTGF